MTREEYLSNRTALAKLTGISLLHGSHVAVPIACDASNARTMAIREYHYHDKKVMAAILLKITFELLT
ncbi:conjugal transfer protein [Staphylococcus pseudintermedius]|uniref:Conjugal transfer protein n=4 Tax=Bacilli TaxID=91061 RepID=A0A1L6XCQ7_9LACO|nr:conjugal transfer protein [Amylolactobacillus amylophilus DSM 20533 = JCM 1125]AUS75702.1 conjugal transfer protein [Staphylococcus aureus]EGQ2707266.1 conjugal transfer protein [Staphylococcus pseudintermedius]KAB7527678.1 conjugal transfer protein [Enterococcus faecium]MCC9942417.1 conjugal transfer protein [Streptococcus agalactiae]MST53103.1 conjugal transfer protein [Streptococcus alactolyticus]NGU12084.1 conjugal transfer protein [Clostridium perfringens]NQP54233.1 conjugal transfer